jgi:hypothetical protein
MRPSFSDDYEVTLMKVMDQIDDGNYLEELPDNLNDVLIETQRVKEILLEQHIERIVKVNEARQSVAYSMSTDQLTEESDRDESSSEEEIQEPPKKATEPQRVSNFGDIASTALTVNRVRKTLVNRLSARRFSNLDMVSLQKNWADQAK